MNPLFVVLWRNHAEASMGKIQTERTNADSGGIDFVPRGQANVFARVHGHAKANAKDFPRARKHFAAVSRIGFNWCLV